MILKHVYLIHGVLVPCGILFIGSKQMSLILKITLEDSSVPPPEVRSLTRDSAYNFKGLLLGEKSSGGHSSEERQYLTQGPGCCQVTGTLPQTQAMWTHKWQKQ